MTPPRPRRSRAHRSPAARHGAAAGPWAPRAQREQPGTGTGNPPDPGAPAGDEDDGRGDPPPPGARPGREAGLRPTREPRTAAEAWAARTRAVGAVPAGRGRPGPAVATPRAPAARRRATATGPGRGRRDAGTRPELPAHFRRRRRIAAAVLATLVGVVAVGLGGRALLYDAGLADVEGVSVTGTRTVPRPDVITAAAVPIGVPLAGVDLDAIEHRVERIPGVAEAEAGRDWPHTVTVTVTERVPVAVADTPQGLQLVDRTGVAYNPAPDPGTLPRLALPGVGPDDPATRAALDVLTALPRALRAEVRAIEVEPPRQVILRLTRDRSVRWGSPDRAEEKAAVLGPLLSQTGSVYDVASPELPTIRR